MRLFLDYLDPSVPLVSRVIEVFDRLKIEQEKRHQIGVFLGPVQLKHSPTHDHSLRVGLLTEQITRFQHYDAKIGLYAGLLHDVGKMQTDLKTLCKTEGWTAADSAEIAEHVWDGYRMLRGHFDFSAEVILWHHRFQPNKYPLKLPPALHTYSEGTRVMIPLYGRLLALADSYDAYHRINDKHGAEPLTGEAIKEKMLKFNLDQRSLVEQLYEAEIFTVQTFPEEVAVT